jgi:hypothetical protein
VRQHFAGQCVSDSNALLVLLLGISWIDRCENKVWPRTYLMSLWKHSLQ